MIVPESIEALKELKLHGDIIIFVLRRRLVFAVQDMRVVLPEGYVSDGFSLPGYIKPLFRHEFRKQPTLVYAAILHDYLYAEHEEPICSRKQADTILRTLMRHYGASWFMAKLFYTAVRAFGRKYYRKRPPVIYT